MRTAAIALGATIACALAACAPAPSEEPDPSTDAGDAVPDVTVADILRDLEHDSDGLPRPIASPAAVSNTFASLTPEDVYIESISTGGPGCPDESTVTTVISADRTTFLVIYDEMILGNPFGSPVKNINCVAGIKLHVPNGWQVSVATVDTRGYAYLSPGIKARQTSEYFFAGQPLGSAFHSQLKGLYDDNYVFTDTIPFESVVWSPCGTSAIFAINTKLNLNAVANPTGLAHFNAETTDGKFEKVLHWLWRQC